MFPMKNWREVCIWMQYWIVLRGEEKVNKLALLLAKEGKIDEFIKSAEDKAYQKQLLIEYGLEDE